MIGQIRQLYEKDGAEFKPIQACDCENQGSGGEENNGGGTSGGSLPDSISATASAYSSEIPEAEASVNPTTGLFTFKFGLPRGERGPQGPQGPPGTGGGGIEGDTPVAHKSVMVFRSYVPTDNNPKPVKPDGGSWDVENDIITYPENWGPTDNVEKPVWMSTGEFSSANPADPKWSDPIMISGEDGTNGTDGVSREFIYKLTKTSLDVPDKPQSVNETDYVPRDEGWDDSPSGISEEMQCEWVCTRKKNNNGNWSSWDGPVIWAKWGVNGIDGDGVEYIYKVNNGEVLDNPTPDNTSTDEYQGKGEFEGKEYVPRHLGWTDEPTGVSIGNTHEWVCVRKQKDGIWQPFSNPALWAKFGEKGNNGISVRTMYAKTSGSDDVPEFVVDNIYPGSIWGLVIPRHESHEAIWSIQAYVTYDNKLAEIILDNNLRSYGWQGPILVTGTSGKDGTPVNYKTYICKLSDGKPDKPTSNDPKNPGDGWLDYPNTTGQWWQCIGTVNGVTELVTEWSEVLPVNGRDGIAQDGKRVEFRFATNGSQTNAPYINKAIRQPSGWTTQPPIKEENQFMWMIVATINPDDTLAVNWSEPVCISGERGPQGFDGPAGPAGPAGPSGISGIPGKDIEARYCLGTEDSYNATYNTTVANKVDPVSYGWSETIPSVTEDYPYIWCIQTSFIYRRENENSESYVRNLEYPWSTPFRLNGINGIDGKGVGISSVDEYYLVTNKNSGITTSSTGWVKNSIPAFTNTKIYLWNYEVINYENGTSAEPTTPAIIGTKGVDGVDGADGRGITSITEKYLASAKTSGVDKNTSGWSTTVPATTKDAPYLWNWERILYTDGTYDDFYAIIGSRGSDGTSGGGGQIIYPAGIYSNNKSYTADDDKAPYVFDPSDNNYYVLNYVGTWLGTEQNNITPSQDYAANNGKYWMLMQSFDAIYANIGVFGSALVGAAVFNGDYMFSQLGKGIGNSESSNYKLFNSSSPYEEVEWKTYTSSTSNNLSVPIKGNIGGYSRITFSDGSHIDTTPYNVLNIDDDLTLVAILDRYAASSSILTGTSTGSDANWQDSISNVTLSSSNKYLLHTKYIKFINASGNTVRYYSEIALLHTYNPSKTINSIKNYYDYDKFYPNWCVNLRTGEQWIGAGKTYFNSDGSGYLKGDLVADVFTPLLFTEDTDKAFILSKIPNNASKNFTIPYIYNSRVAIRFTFNTEKTTDIIVYTDREGNSIEKTGTLSITPSGTYHDIGGIGYIDCYGVGNKWHLIERSVKVPTIKFVNSLPSKGVEGILYVLI